MCYHAITGIAASSSLLQGSALEYDDIVSLSPLLPEHTHEVNEVSLRMLPTQAPKGKGKARAVISEEALVAHFQDILGR